MVNFRDVVLRHAANASPLHCEFSRRRHGDGSFLVADAIDVFPPLLLGAKRNSICR